MIEIDYFSKNLKKELSKDIKEIFISMLLERLDFTDILILKKFYLTGKEFPNDVQPYCFPILYNEMKINNNLKITKEGLRKRLNNLVKIGLIEKIKGTNPSIYLPVRDKEEIVRELIKKFFVVHGLASILE